MVQHALDGYAISELAGLLAAECHGDDLRRSLDRLLSVGHSSGFAMLHGVLHTLTTVDELRGRLTAPANTPDGLFLGSYGPEDANPDIGDSAIAETAGVGGMSMATAPTIVRFVGGSVRTRWPPPSGCTTSRWARTRRTPSRSWSSGEHPPGST